MCVFVCSFEGVVVYTVFTDGDVFAVSTVVSQRLISCSQCHKVIINNSFVVAGSSLLTPPKHR